MVEMATRAKKTKTKTKKAASKKVTAVSRKTAVKVPSTKKAPARKKTSAPKKKTPTAGKPASRKASRPKKFPPVRPSADLSPKASRAVKSAADALWGVGVTPHTLLKELHEVLLLRCLSEAQGNYASAAKLFGPSRQSVQQYANSALRDVRWAPYQQNQRTA